MTEAAQDDGQVVGGMAGDKADAEEGGQLFYEELVA